MRQGVFSAWGIQIGPFEAHWAHFVPKFSQLFHLHTGRPILITPELEAAGDRDSQGASLFLHLPLTMRMRMRKEAIPEQAEEEEKRDPSRRRILLNVITEGAAMRGNPSCQSYPLFPPLLSPVNIRRPILTHDHAHLLRVLLDGSNLKCHRHYFYEGLRDFRVLALQGSSLYYISPYLNRVWAPCTGWLDWISWLWSISGSHIYLTNIWKMVSFMLHSTGGLSSKFCQLMQISRTSSHEIQW